ncbi:unnamed protein product [Macrosiphum euphorbiae]|uniref:Uncharacterized protein n=1 Tax=Macrosiphum euphorbiae TaxID=13131 RepID=A0AAV0WWC6_9HEMI|nr:unnamed protein product [Macrosiphum euphorbiae]
MHYAGRDESVYNSLNIKIWYYKLSQSYNWLRQGLYYAGDAVWGVTLAYSSVELSRKRYLVQAYGVKCTLDRQKRCYY